MIATVLVAAASVASNCTCGITNISDSNACGTNSGCTSITYVGTQFPDSVGNFQCDTWTSFYAPGCDSIPDAPDVAGSATYAPFYNCTALVSVDFPNLTGNIGQYAFYNCESLSSANFPNMEGNIGRNAFTGTALKSANFPAMTGSIGNYAFTSCLSLVNATFPLASSVGGYVFNGAANMRRLCLPSVGYVSQHALEGTNITSVWMPPTFNQADRESVLSFLPCTGNGTCDHSDVAACGEELAIITSTVTTSHTTTTTETTSHITTTTVTTANPQCTCTQSNLTTACGSSSGCREITYVSTAMPSGRLYPYCQEWTSFYAPHVTGSLGTNASTKTFEICTKLESVNFPSVTGSILDDTFYDCTSLTSAQFPEMTGDIGTHAFDNTALTIADFPAMKGNIGVSAFKNTDDLLSVNFPLMEGNITDDAFMNSGVVSVKFPSMTGKIGNGAFHGCSSLVNASFPFAIKSGVSSFRDASDLERLCLRSVETSDTALDGTNTNLKSVWAPLLDDQSCGNGMSCFENFVKDLPCTISGTCDHSELAACGEEITTTTVSSTTSATTTATTYLWWEVVVGDCIVTNNCVNDGSPESEDYSKNAFCRIKALQNLIINVERYDTEPQQSDGTYYDYVEIDGIKYAGYTNDGPHNVEMNADDNFTWITDNVAQSTGWKLCAILNDALPSTTTDTATIITVPSSTTTDTTTIITVPSSTTTVAATTTITAGSSSTTASQATSTEEDDDDTGLIVGLSVGGVAILVVVGIIVKYSMKGGSGKAGYRLL